MAATTTGSSTSSETKAQDISVADGFRITKAAAAWKGTQYSLVGAHSVRGVGGDCSGSTWLIYAAAGFPYEYQATGTFLAYVRKTGRFRELGANERRQDGDILYWPNHMAIYSTFAMDQADATTPRINKQHHAWTQKNDMWTASHPGGQVYGPAELRFWRPDAPRVFRYVK